MMFIYFSKHHHREEEGSIYTVSPEKVKWQEICVMRRTGNVRLSELWPLNTPDGMWISWTDGLLGRKTFPVTDWLLGWFCALFSSVKAAYSTVRALGPDPWETELREPSRTEKVLFCCQQYLTGEEKNRPNLSPHKKALKPDWSLHRVADLKQTKSPLRTNDRI